MRGQCLGHTISSPDLNLETTVHERAADLSPAVTALTELSEMH